MSPDRPRRHGLRLALGLLGALAIGAIGAVIARSPRAGAEGQPAALARLSDGSDRISQPAELRQRMGKTEVAVVYNRPSARGRVLFGGIVPYDSIWNPGADGATRIEVSRDVWVEGEPLPAGKYSVWLIPRAGGSSWTSIFSRAAEVFHVPYPEGEDALRLEVRPRRTPHVETLSFTFPVASRDSAVLAFRWGEVALPLTLRAAP